MTAISPNLWSSADHALQYLARADRIPHRTEGERALLEWLPARVDRFLDLGSGDGRLAVLVKTVHPAAQVVALDFSALMLERQRERFADDRSITILNHSLDHPLPALGKFDAVVSSFAIHHVSHERKRALYAQLRDLLAPGGVFCDLEHVASPTPALHARFLSELNLRTEDEDASNQLLDVETQLSWLRELGFEDVDCTWKWMELALLVGRTPNAEAEPEPGTEPEHEPRTVNREG
jgi:tRNA (cmo5U34)-methyltransferase